MKVFVLFALLALAAADTEYYTTADDYFDMNAAVADLPTLQSFIDCFLDKGPCTDIAYSYKILVPESIATGCARCNNAQKHLANVFFRATKDNFPNEYFIFRERFDPYNEHFDDFIQSIDGY